MKLVRGKICITAFLLAFYRAGLAADQCMVSAQKGVKIFNDLREILAQEIPLMKFQDHPYAPEFKKWNDLDLKFDREYDQSLIDFPISMPALCTNNRVSDSLLSLIEARVFLVSAHDHLVTDQDASEDLMNAFSEFQDAQKSMRLLSRHK